MKRTFSRHLPPARTTWRSRAGWRSIAWTCGAACGKSPSGTWRTGTRQVCASFRRRRRKPWRSWACCMTCARRGCITRKQNDARTRKRENGRTIWVIHSGTRSRWATGRKACFWSPATWRWPRRRPWPSGGTWGPMTTRWKADPAPWRRPWTWPRGCGVCRRRICAPPGSTKGARRSEKTAV